MVKVYQGRRLIRRLTRGGESEDDKYFKDKNDDNDDDECDDDDDDDDDYDDDNDKNGKRNYMFAEPLRADRKAKVVSVHGNGEPVRIVFKSDPWVTRRGFFAHYTMGKGKTRAHINQIKISSDSIKMQLSLVLSSTGSMDICC